MFFHEPVPSQSRYRHHHRNVTKHVPEEWQDQRTLLGPCQLANNVAKAHQTNSSDRSLRSGHEWQQRKKVKSGVAEVGRRWPPPIDEEKSPPEQLFEQRIEQAQLQGE